MPTCKSCDEEMPLASFRRLPTGRTPRKCRACEVEAQRAYQRKYDAKKRAEKKQAPLAERVARLEAANAELERRLQKVEAALTTTTNT